MIKIQDLRRLEALEALLAPREQVVIFTGVPRPPGTHAVDAGSAYIIRTGPEDWDDSAEAVVDSVETEDEAFSYTIDFGDEVEPSVTTFEATSAPEPVVGAPAQRTSQQPAVEFNRYRGRYSWMR